MGSRIVDENEPLLASYQSGTTSVTLPSYQANEQEHRQHAKQFYRNQHHQSMVDSTEKVTLTWENVDVYVEPPRRACCRGPDPNIPRKQVLKQVYGHLKPGTLMAIIGASGSGKTTLLNTLTSRNNPDIMNSTGDIRVNGVDVGIGIRNISAYVQQDDMFIATMTVREHLTFRALLRMEQEVSRKRRIQRVEEVIQELGLTKCADNIIGNPGRIKGISGGEMRRLSFASEILTNPPLLFCDEPTSGLDSFMAENIVTTLKTMAGHGKTILCTIHQPSSEVYALFDTVLVMAEGRVAFMGQSDEALKFYEKVGYPCLAHYNPADFYIMTMAVVPGKEEQCKSRIQTICDAFDQSSYNNTIVGDTKQICANPSRTGVIFEEAFSSTSRYESPWYVQFGAVFKRCWNTSLREPMVIKVRVGQTIMIGIILSLIYLQLDIDQQGVQDVNGVLFLMITNMTFSNIFGVLNVMGLFLGLCFSQMGNEQSDVMGINGIMFLILTEACITGLFSNLVSFPLELPIFLREYGIGLYRVDIYFLCKMLSEFPSYVIIPMMFSAICYWMVGLYGSFEAFAVFTGIILLVANISVSFGYVISTASDSVNTALALAPPLMIPLMMFGGFFLNSDSIPKYFIWLEYMSWFKYSNELLAINQWQNIDEIDGCTAMANATCGQGCLFKDGEAVISYLNFDKDNRYLDIALLFTLLVAYRIAAFLILLIKAKRSKR